MTITNTMIPYTSTSPRYTTAVKADSAPSDFERTGNDVVSGNSGELKKPRSITQYDLFRGVTDFGNLAQFDYFESGYPFLFVLNGPKFLNEYAISGENNGDFAPIYKNYMHMLEFEFLGMDGLENMTSETLEISNGIDTMNLINKVKLQSASTVTMRYTERSGGLINKFHEKFLSGIRDPRTQVKHYHGMIGTSAIPSAGFEYETFTFLYVTTDNTTKNVEKAYLLLGAQPTTADNTIYNEEKGTIEKKEISIEFNCFPVHSKSIDVKAQQLINAIHEPAGYGLGTKAKLYVDSSDMDYTIRANTDGTITTLNDNYNNADKEALKNQVAAKYDPSTLNKKQ